MKMQTRRRTPRRELLHFAREQPTVPAGQVMKYAVLALMIVVLGCGQASVAVEGGAGVGRTEAGPALDSRILDVGGSPGADGAEAGTPRDGAATMDTPERRDLAGTADGSLGVDRSIPEEAGSTSQDGAMDAPTTTLPPGPCQGTCGAICTGTCIGKACLVTTAGGQCASSCDGWCDGTCSGSCTPMGQPCVVQGGAAVPDGQNCPAPSGAPYLCEAGTCTPIQPAGACVLPAGQTYKDGSYERNFIIPGERCPSGGRCRDGTCCRGCWDGSTCLPGDTLASCGSEGAMCERCGWICTVFSGPVNNPCGGAYGMDSFIAYQPICGGACGNAPTSSPTCCGLSGTASCSPEAGCQ